MSWEQRKHFYQWIGKKLNMEQEESQIFMARFNPDNQYKIKTLYQGQEKEVEAFLLKDKFMVSSNRSCNPDFIVDTEKLNIN
jgi:hypothetical protein